MIIFKGGTAASHARKITLRCPSCRKEGTFDSLIDNVIQTEYGSDVVWLGQRRCPNPNCYANVFVVWDRIGKVIAAYPPERIDFDPTNIPPKIIATFEEALTCHANEAYTAAAIMVRRTLEELCSDKQAKGKTLKDRIQALSGTVILPPPLISGLDNLRLLGNDAAHVEAQDYDQIGKTEVEVAMDVTKEVLKSVYQLDELVKRLEGLKKSSPPANP